MTPPKVVAILAFLVVAVGVTMEITVGSNKMRRTRPIAYELPKSGADLRGAVQNATPAAIRANTYFDFFFIAAYATYFILAALLLSGASYTRWPAVILSAAAGIFDVLENLAILAATRIPVEQIDDAAARSIRIPSTVKWLCLFVALALLAFKIGTSWLRWAVVVCSAAGFVATILPFLPAISGAMLLAFLGLVVFAVQTLRT